MNAKTPFAFDRAASTGILSVTLVGFLSAGDAQAFAADMVAACDQARRQTGGLRLLIDATASGIQSGEMTAAMAALTDSVLNHPDDRMALALTSELLKLQAKRAIKRDGVAYFQTVAEARAWLADPAVSR